MPSHLLVNQTVPCEARVLVVCTPKGQDHEIGALAAALFAKMNGWNVCYLGTNGFLKLILFLFFLLLIQKLIHIEPFRECDVILFGPVSP